MQYVANINAANSSIYLFIYYFILWKADVAYGGVLKLHDASC